MIKLSESTLIAVVVPEESRNYLLAAESDTTWRISYQFESGKNEFENAARRDIETHLAFRDKLSILGVVTKGKIDFNCRPYLEQILSDLGEEYVNQNPAIRLVPERALWALLEKHGLRFVNPVTEPLVSAIVLHGSESFMAKTVEREKEQQKLVGKVLILKKQ